MMACQKAIERLLNEAREAGGIGLSGVSFELINHGGNIEFLAIGTVVKKVKNVTTLHQDLHPQVFITDKERFDLDKGSSSSSQKMQQGPIVIIFFI